MAGDGAERRVVRQVAQARAAAHAAHVQGRAGLRADAVVYGRCARCGRVGEVVHFDGVLRARSQEPDP
jgi:hypothetical protein